MSSKDKILARLRETALQNREYQSPLIRDKSVFSDYQTNPDRLTTQFTERLQSLHAECHRIKSIEQLGEYLTSLLKDFAPHQCATHSFPYINRLKSDYPDLAPYLNEIDLLQISSPEFAEFEVGITRADILIARTGSVLLCASSSGGRRLSVLPPLHVVVASHDQLVPSLDDALKKLSAQKMDWSCATFISGPSRTSDIEKELVLGAHGPKRLIVLLLHV